MFFLYHLFYFVLGVVISLVKVSPTEEFQSKVKKTFHVKFQKKYTLVLLLSYKLMLMLNNYLFILPVSHQASQFQCQAKNPIYLLYQQRIPQRCWDLKAYISSYAWRSQWRFPMGMCCNSQVHRAVSTVWVTTTLTSAQVQSLCTAHRRRNRNVMFMVM